MSDTDVGYCWPRGAVMHPIGVWGIGGPSLNTVGLSTSAERTAVVFTVPVSGELHSFEWAMGTVSSLVATLRASWQAVDAAGLPDGTPLETSAVGAPSSNTWMAPTGALETGGVRRTVTAGQRLAAVLDYSAYTSGSCNIGYWGSLQTGQGPTFKRFTASAWTSPGGAPAFALRYTDGYRAVLGTVPTRTTETDTAFNSGSTPDQRGLIWTEAQGRTCLGLWAMLIQTGACDLVLWAGGTEVGRLSGPPVTGAGTGLRVDYFSAPITLSAGVTYRVAVTPTSGTSVTLPSLAVLGDQLQGIADVVSGMNLTTRTDTGAWSETATILPFCGPILADAAAAAAPTDTATGGRLNRGFN